MILAVQNEEMAEQDGSGVEPMSHSTKVMQASQDRGSMS